ncbi:hypothetical protein [Gordonia effusa]|nr:hypothetical protein [Gordonia effusa]
MTELVAKARAAGRKIPEPLYRVPACRGIELQEFVAAHGGPVQIIASFADYDVVHMSRLEPTVFLSGNHLSRPHMMIRCLDEEWVIVDNVQVGYKGTRPTNAFRELAGIGLATDLAKRIVSSRASRVYLDDGLAVVEENSQFTHDWPLLDLGRYDFIADRLVVTIAAEGLGQVVPGPFSGRDGNPAAHPLRAWLTYLDDHTIPWLDHPRRARVYLDRNTAEADGYCTSPGHDHGRRDIYTVIIEQGPVQLWLDIPRSNDPTQRFAPELHAALAAAGFYTTPLDPSNHRSAFAQWLNGLGRTPPIFVDLHDQPLAIPDPRSTIPAT